MVRLVSRINTLRQELIHVHYRKAEPGNPMKEKLLTQSNQRLDMVKVSLKRLLQVKPVFCTNDYVAKTM